jgi:hypothetical protein
VQKYINYHIRLLLFGVGCYATLGSANAACDWGMPPGCTDTPTVMLGNAVYHKCCDMTPRGTTFQAYSLAIGWDFSPDTIQQINSNVCRSYPNAVLISGATRSYNCHNFAWGMASPLWDNGLGANLTDGSYLLRVTRAWEFSYTDLLTFMNDGAFWRVYNADPSYLHSVQMYDMVLLSPGRYAGYGRSKWGEGPLMDHRLSYGHSPYLFTQMQCYKYMGNRP